MFGFVFVRVVGSIIRDHDMGIWLGEGRKRHPRKLRRQDWGVEVNTWKRKTVSMNRPTAKTLERAAKNPFVKREAGTSSDDSDAGARSPTRMQSPSPSHGARPGTTGRGETTARGARSLSPQPGARSSRRRGSMSTPYVPPEPVGDTPARGRRGSTAQTPAGTTISSCSCRSNDCSDCNVCPRVMHLKPYELIP